MTGTEYLGRKRGAAVSHKAEATPFLDESRQ